MQTTTAAVKYAKHIEVLKRAKELLWDGERPKVGEEYICLAIEDVAVEKDEGYYDEPYKSLKDEIAYRLGASNEFKETLRALGFADAELTKSLVQSMRQKFLDELISDFRKGDSLYINMYGPYSPPKHVQNDL
jgi:hypothetical protein